MEITCTQSVGQELELRSDLEPMALSKHFPIDDTKRFSHDAWHFLNAVQKKSMNRLSYLQILYDDSNDYNIAAGITIETVNVACTWPVGDQGGHMFYTDGMANNRGPVNVSSDISPNGFGPEAGGQLAWWIIRADKVVQPFNSNYDPRANDRWNGVLNGMHGILGYYGAVNFHDVAMMKAVGRAIGSGQGAASAWTTSNTASTAAVRCGHEEDVIFDVSAVGVSDFLAWFWSV